MRGGLLSTLLLTQTTGIFTRNLLHAYTSIIYLQLNMEKSLQHKVRILIFIVSTLCSIQPQSSELVQG